MFWHKKMKAQWGVNQCSFRASVNMNMVWMSGHHIYDLYYSVRHCTLKLIHEYLSFVHSGWLWIRGRSLKESIFLQAFSNWWALMFCGDLRNLLCESYNTRQGSTDGLVIFKQSYIGGGGSQACSHHIDSKPLTVLQFNCFLIQAHYTVSTKGHRPTSCFYIIIQNKTF